MRQPYSHEQILEHDQEWAHLVREMRDLRRHHDAMMRRGDGEAVAHTLKQLHELRDQVLYAHRVWFERGHWNRFYCVLFTRVLHTGLACRTITPHTQTALFWELSGREREAVAQQHKLCRHCGRKDTVDVGAPDVMLRGFFRKHYLF